MKNLYQVTVRTTDSDQHSRATHWQKQTLYCGYDLDEARRVYHESEPSDFYGGAGAATTETVFEYLDTDTVPMDEPGDMSTTDADDA